MNTDLSYSAGPLRLRQTDRFGVSLAIHFNSRSVETDAKAWPRSEQGDAYVTLTTITEDVPITTYMLVAQAEAIRHALTSALDELTGKGEPDDG